MKRWLLSLGLVIVVMCAAFLVAIWLVSWSPPSPLYIE